MQSAAVGLFCVLISVEVHAQLPRPRPLGRVEAASRDSFCSTVEIRPLSDGRVIAHDATHQRVVLLDSRLQPSSVLFDATSPRPLTYPRAPARMLAGAGDTTLFVDLDARGLRVIDAAGTVVRRQSVLNPIDLIAMRTHVAGTSLDPRGRIVFAEIMRPVFPSGGPPIQPIAGLGLIRIAPDKMGRDTLAAIQAVSGGSMTTRPIRVMVSPGNPSDTIKIPSPTLQLFESGDDWVMTSDGIVAIVIAADYHVDWYDLDGQRRQTPPVGWPWKVLSAEEKQSLADSAQRITSELASRRGATGYCVPPPPPMPVGITIESPKISTIIADSLPAFVTLHTRADPNGRIWVLEGPSMIGRPIAHPVYDIIDRSGRIVDRVQLPDRTTVAGFGRNGVVYLFAIGASTIKIERAILPPH